MEYATIMFKHLENKDLFVEYRQKGSFVEVRSTGYSEWYLSHSFKTLDEVREYMKSTGSYVEGYLVDQNLNPITEIPKPLHNCYCAWRTVYTEGCRCGGL